MRQLSFLMSALTVVFLSTPALAAHFDVEDNSTVENEANSDSSANASPSYSHTTDNDFPVRTAARTRAGTCEQGLAGQFAGVGAAVATGNPVCDFLAVAESMGDSGDSVGQKRNQQRAEKSAVWRARIGLFRAFITLGLL